MKDLDIFQAIKECDLPNMVSQEKNVESENSSKGYPKSPETY